MQRRQPKSTLTYTLLPYTTRVRSAGDAQHHRRGEAVVGAPAHRAAIVDLLQRGFGIFAELDFGHRHQARHRHADRAADNAFLGERSVEHAFDAELVLEAERHGVDAALGPDVLRSEERRGGEEGV